MKAAQLTTLKAAIAAETDATLVARRNTGNQDGIAKFYSANSSVIVWKPSVTVADFLERCASGIDALSQAKKATLQCLMAGGVLNVDRPAVRKAIADVFPVTPGSDGETLLAFFKRPANRVEAIFARGGDGTDANPHKLDFEGDITTADVSEAMNRS